MGNGDTNLNYQTYNGDLSPYLGKNFGYGQLTQLNGAMGASAGNQPTFISGGNVYQVRDNGNNTFSLQQIDTVNNRQSLAAQQQYQQGVNNAVSGLQTQGTNLAQQYSNLLSDTLGQGTVATNYAQMGENNLLASRGITNNSPYYQTQMSQALLPVQQSNQAAVGSLGFTEAQLQNALASNIAGLRAGAAGTSAFLPLNYGSLALAGSQLALGGSQLGENYAALQNAANIAKMQFTEPYSVSPNNLIYSPSNNSFTQPPTYNANGAFGGGRANIAGLAIKIAAKKYNLHGGKVGGGQSNTAMAIAASKLIPERLKDRPSLEGIERFVS